MKKSKLPWDWYKNRQTPWKAVIHFLRTSNCLASGPKVVKETYRHNPSWKRSNKFNVDPTYNGHCGRPNPPKGWKLILVRTVLTIIYKWSTKAKELDETLRHTSPWKRIKSLPINNCKKVSALTTGSSARGFQYGSITPLKSVPVSGIQLVEQKRFDKLIFRAGWSQRHRQQKQQQQPKQQQQQSSSTPTQA